MTDHDPLYHRLFGNREMTAQLLRDFVSEPWLEELDLSAMERENTKFHGDDGDRREGDIVWRIPMRGGGNAYLLLLLEFQSRSERWMALRVLVYVGLLWQQLLREKRIPAGGRLPPVLYNGDARWAAPTNLADLIALSEDHGRESGLTLTWSGGS